MTVEKFSPNIKCPLLHLAWRAEPPGLHDHLPQHRGLQTGGSGQQQGLRQPAEDPHVAHSPSGCALVLDDWLGLADHAAISTPGARLSVSPGCHHRGHDRGGADAGRAPHGGGPGPQVRQAPGGDDWWTVCESWSFLPERFQFEMFTNGFECWGHKLKEPRRLYQKC